MFKTFKRRTYDILLKEQKGIPSVASDSKYWFYTNGKTQQVQSRDLNMNFRNGRRGYTYGTYRCVLALPKEFT